MKGVRKSQVAVYLTMAALAASLLGGARAEEAAADEKAEEPKTVEERLDEVDQRVKIMERKEEIAKEEAAKKAAAAAGADKDGFVFKSADGSFKLRIRGVVQGDARFWQDDELKPNVDTFLVRRARPIVEGTVYKYFDFRIMPDFGSGTTSLQDAYVDAKLGKAPIKVRARKFKAP